MNLRIMMPIKKPRFRTEEQEPIPSDNKIFSQLQRCQRRSLTEPEAAEDSEFYPVVGRGPRQQRTQMLHLVQAGCWQSQQRRHIPLPDKKTTAFQCNTQTHVHAHVAITFHSVI